MNRQTKRKSSDKQSFTPDTGRIQPQAVDLEEAVLGALMIEKSAYQTVCDILRPESFYSPVNVMIYSAIADLAGSQSPIDMLTVTQQLRNRGELETVGGPYYISQLTSKVASSSHIEYHAMIIAQKALARQLIALTAEIHSRAFDETEDIDEVFESLEVKFTELSIKRICHETAMKMHDAVKQTLDRAAQTQADRTKGNITAIPTGIDALTREFYGGWKSPDLVILAGRPSMGKTQVALHLAKSAAQSAKNVFFVSIEMSARQLVTRLLLEDEQISAYNLATGQMSSREWKAIDQRAETLINMKMHIADGVQTRYLDNICSESRRLKRMGELDMIVIDYLGLICLKQKFERRQLEIAHITRTLKSLAKELDVPIILLSQLSRPEKGTAVREPQLHDLRESGDIEQDADIVLFIHRPGYYDDKDAYWKDKGKIIISKYREGARSRAVVFQHDRNFKKIWGLDSETDSNYCRDRNRNTNAATYTDYSQPSNDQPF